ncbi:hypothetical protein B9Z55_024580 [Caenorhabditis nigoni]|uniref:Uncharacterized protein n=1 Tax=Caenorhabditis nigoni TaxID=1611254 RepID=A0A2G5SUM6_9PELO|nr:hypothetical protein B9Z55_024580 [Caenorhabditis nigoni]
MIKYSMLFFSQPCPKPENEEFLIYHVQYVCGPQQVIIIMLLHVTAVRHSSVDAFSPVPVFGVSAPTRIV